MSKLNTAQLWRDKGTAQKDTLKNLWWKIAERHVDFAKVTHFIASSIENIWLNNQI